MAINIVHSTTLPVNADCPSSKNDCSMEMEMIWVEAGATDWEVLSQIYMERLRKDMKKARVICGIIFFLGFFLCFADRASQYNLSN